MSSCITKEELEAAYRLRGVATEKERSVEDEIFSVGAEHAPSEIEQLLKRYKTAKDARASASLEAARLYMLAPPSVRRAANWRQYTPGHENDVGRGTDSDKLVI